MFKKSHVLAPETQSALEPGEQARAGEAEHRAGADGAPQEGALGGGWRAPLPGQAQQEEQRGRLRLILSRVIVNGPGR